jgi:2'-5' RNA ligase
MRLFIALTLPDDVESYLSEVIYELRPSARRAKWVDARNIHLTARFLGDTEERLLDPIKQLMDDVASDHKQVSCLLSQIGAFPNVNSPRVLWAGLSGDTPKLKRLVANVESEIQLLGFNPESKPFRPHLTLARFRDPRDVDNLPSALDSFTLKAMPMIFDRLILYKSTLTRTGPIYDTLHVAQLKQ